MTSVSGTRSDAAANNRAQQARPQPGNPQPAAKPEDVRAMSDAFAAARAKMKLDPFAARPGGKQQASPKMPAKGDAKAAPPPSAALVAAFERAGADRRQAEKFAEGQGFAPGGQGAALAPPPIALPAIPAPQVDPSAFAQMLADLWTRENGRGSKEVRVRFGSDAWPATGALLTQSADGLLDITVDMARGDLPVATDGLRDALAARGLMIGRLATAE